MSTGDSDVKSKGSEYFEFLGDNDNNKTAGVKPWNETATSGNPDEEPEQVKPQEAPRAGILDRATVLEARKRADSNAGLDIAAFVQEFKILSFDVESVLNGPLPAE